MKKIIHWYSTRNYASNPILDAYLLNGIESGIETISYATTSVDGLALCKFNNGISYKFWNSNIPYAWLSDGIFMKGDNIIYKYNSSMPSRRVMNKFYNAIYEFLLKRED